MATQQGQAFEYMPLARWHTKGHRTFSGTWTVSWYDGDLEADTVRVYGVPTEDMAKTIGRMYCDHLNSMKPSPSNGESGSP